MNRFVKIISLLLCVLLVSSCSPAPPVYQIAEPDSEPITLSEDHALELQRIINAVRQQPADPDAITAWWASSVYAVMSFSEENGDARYTFDSISLLLIVDDANNTDTQYYSCKQLQFDRVLEIYNIYSFFRTPKLLPDNYGQAWTMDEFKFYDADGNVVESADAWHDIDENGDGTSYRLTNYPAGTTTFRGTEIGDSAAKALSDYNDIGYNAMYGSDDLGWEPMKTSTNLIDVVESAGKNWIFVMLYYDQDLEPFSYYNYMFNPSADQKEIEGYWSFAMKFENGTLVHLGFFYHEIA